MLEVGPGPGFFSLDVARAVPRGRLELVDIQHEMLEKARRRLQRAGIRRVGFTQANAAALPFRPDLFDTAFLVSVLGEIPDSPACVASIARLLRGGGRLVFVELPGDPDAMSEAELRELSTGTALRFVASERVARATVTTFIRSECHLTATLAVTLSVNVSRSQIVRAGMHTTFRHLFASAVALAFLVSTAFAQAPAAGQASPAGQAPGAQGRGAAPARIVLSVTSNAWPDGGEIPMKFSSRGENKSPDFEFHWTQGNAPASPPEGLQSYAIVFRDMENSTNKGTTDTLHWSLFNIPGTARGLPEGLGKGDLPDGSRNGPGIANRGGNPGVVLRSWRWSRPVPSLRLRILRARRQARSARHCHARRSAEGDGRSCCRQGDLYRALPRTGAAVTLRD